MRNTLAATALLLVACVTKPPAALAPVEAHSYGLTRENAIEVCKPEGQRAYLSRLHCTDGSRPQFQRLGSTGMRNAPKSAADEEHAMKQMVNFDLLPAGVRDFHTLDIYELRCGDQKMEVLLDMYHCQQAPPALAPPGFRID